MNTTNTKTLITVKIDKGLKLAAQELAKKLGIPLGTIINSFLRQMVRSQDIYFSVSNKPNPYIKTIIDSSK
jgi:addiction module RelB/DinJ family antitoxin